MEVLSHSRSNCVAKCARYTQIQLRSEKTNEGTHARGGAYEESVYMCEASDMNEKQGLLSREVYEVSTTMSASLPSLLSEAVTPSMFALKTNGDGACGIHALLGRPVQTASGALELFAECARETAATHLGPSMEVILQRPGIQRHVESIRDFFWDGFVVAHLKGGKSQDCESELFWERLVQLNPHLAEEAVQCFSNNSETSTPYERAKSETVRASRKFFQTNIEAAVVRPLAVQMGYIPADVDVFALTEIERKHLSEQPCNNEFLKDAFWSSNGNHFVRGTQAPFPVIGPSCKYIALFDDRPEFDALRLSFLISADPEQLLQTFVTKLQCLVHETIDSLSAQQI